MLIPRREPFSLLTYYSGLPAPVTRCSGGGSPIPEQTPAAKTIHCTALPLTTVVPITLPPGRVMFDTRSVRVSLPSSHNCLETSWRIDAASLPSRATASPTSPTQSSPRPFEVSYRCHGHQFKVSTHHVHLRPCKDSMFEPPGSPEHHNVARPYLSLTPTIRQRLPQLSPRQNSCRMIDSHSRKHIDSPNHTCATLAPDRFILPSNALPPGLQSDRCSHHPYQATTNRKRNASRETKCAKTTHTMRKSVNNPTRIFCVGDATRLTGASVSSLLFAPSPTMHTLTSTSAQKLSPNSIVRSIPVSTSLQDVATLRLTAGR